MSRSEDEEPLSQRGSDAGGEEEEEDQDEEVEENDDDNSAVKPAEEEAEDNFDEEEEVLAPKPFPRTIHVMLPGRLAGSASSPSSSTSATLEKQPTRVHVCLTRGTIDGRGDETSQLEASYAVSAAARMQGCCSNSSSSGGGPHRFESDYAARLAGLRRRHILRRLHGNSDRQRRFLLQERKNAARRAQRKEKGDGGSADDDDVEDGEGEDGNGNLSAAAPAAQQDGDGGAVELDEDADPAEGITWAWTAVQRPPPYWLPSLLANDAQTFHRVLHVMYGWVIAPEPHPSDRLRLNAAGQLLSGPSDAGGGPGGGGAGEDDDEDLEQADPAHHKPDFFLPSNAFGGGDEDEDENDDEGAEKDRSVRTDRGENAHASQRASKSLLHDFNACDAEDAAAGSAGASLQPPASPSSLPSPHAPQAYGQTALQAKLSTVTAPPPVVALPSFPFADYEFYLAHDTASDEWHLLDTHPLFVTEACRRRRAEQRQQLGLSPDEEGEENEGDGSRRDEQDDDDDGAGGEEEDEDDEANGRSTDRPEQRSTTTAGGGLSGEEYSDLCPVPAYDMQTLIPVSPLILAALFSAPALRCCLLQPLKAAGDVGASDAVEDAGELEESGGGGGTGGSGVVPQRQRLSDRDVLRTFDHAWLAADVAVGLPILATICRARQHVLQQDATRIPYPLTALWLDVRPLFALADFANAARHVGPAEVRQWCAGPGEEALDEDDGIMDNNNNNNNTFLDTGAGAAPPSRPLTAMPASAALPHRWGGALDHIVSAEHYGRVVLSALLAADILPTQPVGLTLFDSVDGLRLALWWWLRLPQRLLRQWGVDGAAAAAAAAARGADGEEEGENGAGNETVDGSDGGGYDDDEAAADVATQLPSLRPDEATEALAQRVARQQQRSGQTRQQRQRCLYGPLLFFAPLLLRVLLELQRRLDRRCGEDSTGRPLAPSQFTLLESVARTYAVERLDSGRPRQDPLVTSTFTGVSLRPSRQSASAADHTRLGAPAVAEHTSKKNEREVNAAVRHHRLYQSDLVLLALALTTTPAPSQTAVKSGDDKYGNSIGSSEARAPPQRPIAMEVEDVAETKTDAYESDAEDGHTPLFRHLFEAKLMRCVRSPVDRARAGTTKLLLLCAADFCLSATRRCVFAHLPSYELFGSTGYCPLPELVQAWAAAVTGNSAQNADGAGSTAPQMQATLHDFTYFHWNEVRWRLNKGQYNTADVRRMQAELPALFTLVESHTATYYNILARLQSEAEGEAAMAAAKDASFPSPTHTPRLPSKASTTAARAGRPQRPSLVSGAMLQATRQDAHAAATTPSYASPTSDSAFFPAPAPLTVAQPNVYSAAVVEAKAHVYDLWRAFPVAASTYFTAETLTILLFGRTDAAGGSAVAEEQHGGAPRTRLFNTAALRVLLENGVHTVQPCPLDSAEVPAVEAALNRADVDAVKVLLGLGAASLHDLRADGSATLESWAEAIFSPADMEVLHYIEAKNDRVVRTDPRVQYGARRFEATVTRVQ